MLAWNPFGPITGVFDASLETAVEDFQQSNGLTVDGIVGPATWAKLPPYREASPTLQRGSLGPVVEFPPYAGAVDGIFGPLTRKAVEGLQTWAGAAASGIVDDDTWFIWLTPGSAQQLTVEAACGLLRALM
jgi:peptidoglycan hydrolase-like protein with peptidoglycan-binding domain